MSGLGCPVACPVASNRQSANARWDQGFGRFVSGTDLPLAAHPSTSGEGMGVRS